MEVQASLLEDQYWFRRFAEHVSRLELPPNSAALLPRNLHILAAELTGAHAHGMKAMAHTAMRIVSLRPAAAAHGVSGVATRVRVALVATARERLRWTDQVIRLRPHKHSSCTGITPCRSGLYRCYLKASCVMTAVRS